MLLSSFYQTKLSSLGRKLDLLWLKVQFMEPLDGVVTLSLLFSMAVSWTVLSLQVANGSVV